MRNWTRRSKCALTAATLMLGAAAVPAEACSVKRTYIKPTNFELVATTDTIVVAEADRALPSSADADIAFIVEESIKGTLEPGDTVRTSGSTDPRYFQGRSSPDDFSRARPGAYAGACIAGDYRLGQHYVLFLWRNEGQWSTWGPPFSRVNEEIDYDHDGRPHPWLIAVREYARIAELSSYDQQSRALRRLREHATSGDAPAALIGDIDTHFARPTPYKPFSVLKELYESATEVETRRHALLAMAVEPERAAAKLMRDRLYGLIGYYSDSQRPDDDLPGDPGTVEDTPAWIVGLYYRELGDARAITPLAQLYGALGEKPQWQKRSLMAALVELAGDSHTATMVSLLDHTQGTAFITLAKWFGRHPDPRAVRVMHERLGSPTDNFDLALALADAGDERILTWAKRQLVDPPARQWWVPGYVIARSPLTEANELAARIIEEGGKMRRAVIEGYEEAKHQYVDRRLKELKARADLTAVEERSLRRVLERR